MIDSQHSWHAHHRVGTRITGLFVAVCLLASFIGYASATSPTKGGTFAALTKIYILDADSPWFSAWFRSMRQKAPFVGDVALA